MSQLGMLLGIKPHSLGDINNLISEKLEGV